MSTTVFATAADESGAPRKRLYLDMPAADLLAYSDLCGRLGGSASFCDFKAQLRAWARLSGCRFGAVEMLGLYRVEQRVSAAGVEGAERR